ncbi:LexA family protein [Acidithiobacillus sp. IBUN Pt1247-S3]|uniref:LexA family protein n=1 Tax=Acidithiobacillus sp. IBUN Pt1247-S3 TaxID=3166642 RepID=UPI0034E3D4EB
MKITGSKAAFDALERDRLRRGIPSKRRYALDVLQLNDAQNYSHWEKRGVPLKELVRLSKLLGCSVEDLSNEGLTSLCGSGGSHEQRDDSVQEGPDFRAWYPLVGFVPGGEPKDVVERYRRDPATEWIPTSLHCSPNSFYLRVVGKSMEPDIPDGSLVLVDPGLSYQHGDIVVARNGDNEANVKTLLRDGGSWYLAPKNPDYPTKPLGECVIVGVVREAIRRFR